MSARTSPVIAFGAAALGIAIYSVMDTLMKRLSIDSGAYSAVLWRSWVGVAMAMRSTPGFATIFAVADSTAQEHPKNLAIPRA